ncbi:hypothetical protein MKZ38_008795 [Zalerion maritima]|uniref:Uncharacterized protein n=1 Tax=Zalerion maritima TaxID=339359 RepID=A0AAD5RHP1_9PEZI|nr:hypothetical protein MKZ38_008795 [Zalerion maritima]
MCQELYVRYQCEKCSLLHISDGPVTRTKCAYAKDFGLCARNPALSASSNNAAEGEGSFYSSNDDNSEPSQTQKPPPQPPASEHPRSPASVGPDPSPASPPAPAETTIPTNGIHKLYADETIPKCFRCIDQEARDAIQIPKGTTFRSAASGGRPRPSPSDKEWEAYKRWYWTWSEELQRLYHVDSSTDEMILYPENFD